MAGPTLAKRQRLFDERPKEPVLISACLLGIPCRWRGRRAKRRDELTARLQK